MPVTSPERSTNAPPDDAAPDAAAVSPDALVELCRDQLDSYKKPRQVFFVEALPRNALGKVQKHLLREQLLASPGGAS